MNRSRRRALGLGAVLAVCLGLLTGAAPQESGEEAAPPRRSELTPEQAYAEIKSQLSLHLEEHLFPFWRNSIDFRHGGFTNSLKRDGSVADGRKMLVGQARQVWTFARMWNEGYRIPWIYQGLVGGMNFLHQKVRDKKHGGYFWEVGRQGKPINESKQTYGHAFAIYGAVEFYRASGYPAALKMAEDTFNVLERHAHDDEHGGYYDVMERDWTPKPDGRNKSTNTHMHVLEALTELCMVTGKDRHKERLAEVLDRLIEHAYLPEYHCTIEAFNPDWTPIRTGPGAAKNDHTSYGHNVELAWLMQRAVQALDQPPEKYREIGLNLINHAIRYGWHPQAGALQSSGPWRGPATNSTISWWMQAENAIALDWAWRTTGDEGYLQALYRQVAWILSRQADLRYGGWWDSLTPQGRVKSDRKAHGWHTAYHEVRACLNITRGWGGTTMGATEEEGTEDDAAIPEGQTR
ncbi:MAG: AGE family epimerase/isomerase [Candidatus Brocadiia bacterium]